MNFIISLSILCFVSLVVGIPRTGNGRMKDFPGVDETNESNRLADGEDSAAEGDSVHHRSSIMSGSDWISLNVCDLPQRSTPPTPLTIDPRHRVIYIKARSKSRHGCWTHFDVNLTGSQRLRLEHLDPYDEDYDAKCFFAIDERPENVADCNSIANNPFDTIIDGPIQTFYVSFAMMGRMYGEKLGSNHVIIRATVESNDDGRN